MLHQLECLLCKLEDLRSVPRTHAKVTIVVGCSSAPSTREVETGDSPELRGQPLDPQGLRGISRNKQTNDT